MYFKLTSGECLKESKKKEMPAHSVIVVGMYDRYVNTPFRNRNKFTSQLRSRNTYTCANNNHHNSSRTGHAQVIEEKTCPVDTK